MARHPNYEQSRGEGEIRNILFQNIDINARSIIGDHETLWGTKIAPIKGLIFDNVTISNELIDDINDFNHNNYVEDIKFR